MIYSKILSTGSYLPQRIMTNQEFAERMDTSDEWIRTRTGIAQRHIAAPDESSTDLAYQAARDALQRADIDPATLDLIIVATSTPEHIFPSNASQLQTRLGCQTIAAFDMQAACSGFIFALATADNFIRAGSCKRALVIGAELFSNILDWSDRSTSILFGDGAGAVVLGVSDDVGIISSRLHADGHYLDLLKVPAQMVDGQICGSPFVEMDGQGVFKFAVKQLAAVAQEVLEMSDYTADQVDWMIPHQANRRIIESTAKHLGLSMDKVILTVAEHANTSAASIPLALDAGVRDGRIQRGQILLLEGIGGGFAWGAVLIQY